MLSLSPATSGEELREAGSDRRQTEEGWAQTDNPIYLIGKTLLFLTKTPSLAIFKVTNTLTQLGGLITEN